MGSSPPATIPNPKLAELKRALGSAKSVQSAADPRLDDVVSAMSGHAWSGTPTSDAFFSELKANVKDIHSATQGCVDNVQSAINNCPSTVPNPAAKH
jgi:uncharacterized membrane protein